MRPCQGRDRGFESRRDRREDNLIVLIKLFLFYARFGRPLGIRKGLVVNSPDTQYTGGTICCGLMRRGYPPLYRLTLFRAADDELFRGFTVKSFFIIVTVLVLDQKTVVTEKGINFLGEKLPHLKREHRFFLSPFISK